MLCWQERISQRIPLSTDACLPSKLLKWLPVRRKCPWQALCPHITRYMFHHVAHYNQPAQTSLYLNWPAVCYVTARWKARKRGYISARDAADDMWGRERPRPLSKRGRSYFHLRSRHHPLPSAVTPLIHYLSAAAAWLPDHVILSPCSHGLSLSFCLFLSPFLLSFQPSLSLHHSNAVCQCLLLCGEIHTNTCVTSHAVLSPIIK